MNARETSEARAGVAQSLQNSGETIACPECRFRFTAKKMSEKGEEEVFIFDTNEIKKELEDIPINSPPVLKFIKGLFKELKFDA